MRESGNKSASSHLNFLLKSPTDIKVLKGRGGGDGGFSQVGCVGFTFKHMINYVDINKSDSPPRRREHASEAGSPTLEQFLFVSRHSGGWSLKCVEKEYI